MKTENHRFDRSHLAKNLGFHIKVSTLYSLSSRIINIAIQFGATAVLARILSPTEFGLVAMVGVALDLLINFRDMGLSTVTVQRGSISHAELNFLFWINALVGAVLSFFSIALSPVISAVYNEKRLTAICIALSSMFVFEGLSAQHRALLEREMRFGAISIAQVVSQLLSKALAIIAALYGAGYWSLVLMTTSVPFFRGLFVWYLSPWRPSRPSGLANSIQLIKFGINVSLSRFFLFITEQLDNFLVGRLFGPHALGLYSRSYNLAATTDRLILWPVSPTIIPALSSIQSDHAVLKNITISLINKISFLVHPLCLWMAFCSNELIFILLGSNWSEAIPITQILAFWAFARVTPTASGWLLISLNKTEILRNWNIVECIIISAGIISGTYWGLAGVALGLVLGTSISRVLEVNFCYPSTPLIPKNFFKATFPSIAISVGALIINFSIIDLLTVANSTIINLLTKTLSYFSIYILLYRIFSYQKMKEIFSSLRLTKPFNTQT